MSREPDCLFCKIVAGEIPSTLVDSDERTCSFMDINPASDGHLLVIPKSHSTDLRDIPADDLTACALTAQRLALRMFDGLGADGVNLLNCCGAEAWQTVFHFHLHVIPRYASPAPEGHERDRLLLPWRPTPGESAIITASAEALQE